jgi:hypothetical protein
MTQKLPHVNHLVYNGSGLIVAIRVNIIQEQFEITNNHKLPDPPFADATMTWNLKRVNNPWKSKLAKQNDSP